VTRQSTTSFETNQYNTVESTSQYIIKKYIFKLSSNLNANWYGFTTGCHIPRISLCTLCTVPQLWKGWEPLL